MDQLSKGWVNYWRSTAHHDRHDACAHDSKAATPAPTARGLKMPPLHDSPDSTTNPRRVKKLCSPPPLVQEVRNRSRARCHDEEFVRRPKGASGRQLWTPESPNTSEAGFQRQTASDTTRRPKTTEARGASSGVATCPVTAADVSTYQMIKEPETRPISQDQLINEVKGIYAGLVMVESKCIEVEDTQSSDTAAQEGSKLTNEQWQALIALHRTLLHEHQDFFLASQHPSASPALRRLASKYAMPARMWRHGIHSFLELLRHKLPSSLEHMLSFIYLSYSMMALLYETVPAFEETWIECLGDLGRYRMAIEDDDIRDRELWAGVSRHWYSEASEKSPKFGRLYHHLAILARPNALQQLHYYEKSLCMPIPFPSARESIMTLFDPILNGNPYRIPPVDATFIRVHGILFSSEYADQLRPSIEDAFELEMYGLADLAPVSDHVPFIDFLSCPISTPWKSQDLDPGHTHCGTERPKKGPLTTLGIGNSVPKTCEPQDLQAQNNRGYNHASVEEMETLVKIPWMILAIMLNEIINFAASNTVIGEPRSSASATPRWCLEGDATTRPFPEDYAMRGLMFSDDYYPPEWFGNDKIDEDEKYFEVPSMKGVRAEQLLRLGWMFWAKGRSNEDFCLAVPNWEWGSELNHPNRVPMTFVATTTVGLKV